MRMVSGTFHTLSSGVDLYFGIGFVPDYVKIVDPHGNEEILMWSIHLMRNAKVLSGYEIDDDGAITARTYEQGIMPWRGGNVVTSAQQTDGNCLKWDKLDYSKASNHDSISYNDITKWNFVTGQTGYFDQPCNKTYVDVGSMIWIASGSTAPKRYVIAVLSSNGEVSAEVSLSETSVVSGDIVKITNKYDMIAMKSGERMPAGFWLDAACTMMAANTNEVAYFEAGMYDN